MADADLDELEMLDEEDSTLEIGRRIVRASDLILIARALKIEPDALLRRILRW